MERFEEFLQERVYLIGVTKKTVDYYTWAFNAWKRHAPNDDPKEFVINLRNSGVKPISVNTYICALNTYWKWAGETKHLAYLKEEENILSTLTAEHIRRIVHFKPIRRNETRVAALAVTALDTGMRIQEFLRLTREDVDFDNLIIRVNGKGKKQRLVPMSVELRKVLYRHLTKHNHGRLFATIRGTSLSIRNADRDFKVVCRKLGIAGVRCSFHTLRHSFAVNYLRAGGNLYYLQRILGHSSITATERYLRSLGIDDIQKVHDGLSLLSR